VGVPFHMFGDALPPSHDSSSTIFHQNACLLSLPNEILHKIVQILAGEPSLNPSLFHNTVPSVNLLVTIGLVNKKLFSIASLYSCFRHEISSERQLQHETTDITNDEILRRMYTRSVGLHLLSLPLTKPSCLESLPWIMYPYSTGSTLYGHSIRS
jgi:hypothetical protein